MGLSNLVALCIVVATAVTLNEHGVTNIQTSAQAAEALRPVAGEFAFLVFGLGIVGTGLLAVPVLAGSAAYAVSELFGWKAGLSRGFHEARGFYSIIIAATGIGSVMGYFDVDPIKALVLSAIVNGVISVPIMAEWRAGPLALSAQALEARAGAPDTVPLEDTTLPFAPEGRSQGPV